MVRRVRSSSCYHPTTITHRRLSINVYRYIDGVDGGERLFRTISLNLGFMCKMCGKTVVILHLITPNQMLYKS